MGSQVVYQGELPDNTQINVAEVPGRPVQVTDMLQGAAPGVDIIGGSAEAGQGKQIRLRGNSSVAPRCA